MNRKQTTSKKAFNAYVSLSMNGVRYYTLRADGKLVGHFDKLGAKADQYEHGGELLTAKQAQKRGLIS